MIRRLIRVILARKRDPAGLRAEALRWRTLYVQERLRATEERQRSIEQAERDRQLSVDLIDKVLATAGAGTIQDKPAPKSEPREIRIDDLTDQDFEAQMVQEEIAMWAARAEHDVAARTYLEGMASTNPYAQKALDRLNLQ